jgi:hypothetical protein
MQLNLKDIALKYARELKAIATEMTNYCDNEQDDCDKCGYQRLCMDILPPKLTNYLTAIIADLEGK